MEEYIKEDIARGIERALSDPAVDPNSDNNYALEWCVTNGIHALIEKLLQHPRFITSDGFASAMSVSAAKNDDAMIRIFMEDPRCDHNHALSLCARNGWLGLLTRLLDHFGANPSRYDNDALLKAAMYGHLAVIQRLLQDTRVDPSSSLQCSAVNGYIKIVDLLLKDPRTVPSRNSYWTIRQAARAGHYKVVHRLLQDSRVKLSHELSNWLPIAEFAHLQKYRKVSGAPVIRVRTLLFREVLEFGARPPFRDGKSALEKRGGFHFNNREIL